VTTNVDDAPEQKVRDRIVWVLSHYPKLNITLLSSMVNSYGVLYGVDWRDELETLIERGTVQRFSEIHDNRQVTLYKLK